MTVSRKADLAILELNRKYALALSLAPQDADEHEWAVSRLQDDLAKLKELTGEAPLFDSNYSYTWGYEKYGVYQSLEEMQEVGLIIDGGISA